MDDFVGMGGYAAFVWPAYGLTFLVMALLALSSGRAMSRRERDLALLQARIRGQRR